MGDDAPDLLSKPDRQTIIRAFKTHLARHKLPHDVIEGYATAFIHNGKFILVKTDAERAEPAMKILKDSGATRVIRHG